MRILRPRGAELRARRGGLASAGLRGRSATSLLRGLSRPGARGVWFDSALTEVALARVVAHPA